MIMSVIEETKPICAICGEPIEGGISIDHVFPRSIYKWSECLYSRNEHKNLKDLIESPDNKVNVHHDCNTFKEDTLPDIDVLYLSDEQKEKLRVIEKKIQGKYSLYFDRKKEILADQNGRCFKCGAELRQQAVLRRKDHLKARIWQNACIICHECNYKLASQ